MSGAALRPDGLSGWRRDELAPALVAHVATADLLPASWPRPDLAARSDPRHVFETRFQALARALPEATMSAAAVRAWARGHRQEVAGLLRLNPSYMFFRRLDLSPQQGPLGAIGRPLTAGRSLAVDPRFPALGSPAWVERPGSRPRLVIAHDTGSAITGAGRGDLFCGSGTAAGRSAGAMRGPCRLTPLVRLAEAA